MSELIDAIYQGATAPSRWETVLPAIASWTNARKALVFTPRHPPDRGGFNFSYAIPEEFMQLWSAKYHREDIWGKIAAERGLLVEGSVIICDDLIPLEELRHASVYPVLARFDMVHAIGSIINGDDAGQSLPWSTCALYRSAADGRFTQDERNRLSMLSPHLSRALGVMTRLRDAELKVASSLAALERLSGAVLLFGARGQVVFANHSARRILKEDDGLRLRHLSGNSALGEIVAEESSTHAAMSQAIMSAVSPDILHTEYFSRAVSVPRPSGRQAYTLNFSSLAAQNEFGAGADTPRAIAFIADGAQPITLDAELLKSTFGLTPAEFRLTETMTECHTIEEAAKRLGLSSHTVRAQLRSIYMKTSTNNRAKLMRLLMSLTHVSP